MEPSNRVKYTRSECEVKGESGNERTSDTSATCAGALRGLETVLALSTCRTESASSRTNRAIGTLRTYSHNVIERAGGRPKGTTNDAQGRHEAEPAGA